MTPTRYVFIVTSGRTGSTLLLGMLNAHPGVYIRGENCGFFYYQYKAMEALKLSLAHLAPGAGTHSPFFAADTVDLDGAAATIASICRDVLHSSIPADASVLGFKEIRYDMPDLEDYLRFLGTVFQPATFVFLFRDPAEVASSGFWRSLPSEAAAAKIAAMQQRFRDFAISNAAESEIIDYQDLLSAGEPLRQLFARLGIGFEPARITAALAEPYSYDLESVKFHDNARLQLLSRSEMGRHFSAFHFDRLAQAKNGADVVIAGTLLPRGDSPLSVSSVFAVPSNRDRRDTEARYAGQCGLPSPGLAQKYPDNPHSQTARFRLEVPIGAGSAEIHAEIGGKTVKLGQLTLHEPGQRHFLEPSVGFSTDSRD